MKYSLLAILPLVTTANAAIVVAANGDSVGGTTQTFEGSIATFPGGTKYVSTTTVGTDKTVILETEANRPNNDFFLNYDPTALDINGATAGTGLTVGIYRYVQVFYTLGQAWTGNTQQLRLDTTAEGAAFDTFANSGNIPSTAGTHNFVIDLLSNDGTNLNGTWSGEWEVFRFDFFNNGGNEGSSFTIDKIVYGSTVVPEPSSAMLVGLAGAGLLLRRRK